MKARGNGGPFGVPEGDAWSVNPDGVSCTYGSGTSRNSLYNSSFAHGGPEGSGFGWREPEGSGPMMNPAMGSRPFKLRPK